MDGIGYIVTKEIYTDVDIKTTLEMLVAIEKKPEKKKT